MATATAAADVIPKLVFVLKIFCAYIFFFFWIKYSSMYNELRVRSLNLMCPNHMERKTSKNKFALDDRSVWFLNSHKVNE